MTNDPSEEPPARVVEDAERFRFEVFSGDQLAGFAEYQRGSHEIAFTHTEIDRAFEGRGLGTLLLREALDAVRAEGLAVLPYCPFVRSFIAQHPEYLDLVPEARREAFAL